MVIQILHIAIKFKNIVNISFHAHLPPFASYPTVQNTFKHQMKTRRDLMKLSSFSDDFGRRHSATHFSKQESAKRGASQGWVEGHPGCRS